MNTPLVTVQCLVYNHESFLRKCLDGFVMQKTTFPFEVVVHDDASTDSSAAIIQEYADKYPHIIKPILEKENQYSKNDGTLMRIVLRESKGKYIAFCEGDDFWIDPYKLQKQVDFLENHSNCVMVCSRARLFSQSKNKYIGEMRSEKHSTFLDSKKIILKGGSYITTASIVYRQEVRSENYPDYCVNCHVGDYPLQIMCAMKGAVYYFDEPFVVYRTDNPKSWVGRTSKVPLDVQTFSKRMKGVLSELKMLDGFAHDYPQYADAFHSRINFFMNIQINRTMKHEFYQVLKEIFATFIERESLWWRIDAYMRRYAPHYLFAIYIRIVYRLYLKRF